MFHNLIFDWSGTLVDDLGPVIDATNTVFGKYGVPPLDREQFRRSFRLPYHEFYAEVLPHIPLHELEAHFRPAFESSQAPVTVLPHAREKLESCASLGIRMFVLTSMDPDAFHRQLNEFGFDRFFEATYSGVLDKRALIHQILADHRLNPAETAFVGDMTHDVETARHGGISSIAVLTGYNHPEQLDTVRPDITVPDLGVLRNLFQRHPRRSSPPPPNPPPACSPMSSDSCQMPTPDTIEIRRLKVSCHIGVPDHERAHPQTLLITIHTHPSQGFQGLHDDIRHTIDYAAVASEIQHLASSKPRHLIETLAIDCANHLLTHHPIAAVSITIEKHILPDTECVAVSIHRSR